MLSLRRRKDESIVIQVPGAKPITVTVLRVRGETVSLGFDAPREYGIYRTEVLRKMAVAAGYTEHIPTPAGSN